MSEIKVNSIKGVGASSAAITVNNTDGTATANLTNRQGKNLIINGEFIVDQRMGGTATAITPTGGVNYTTDRWHQSNNGGEAARITYQTISTDVPNGNYRQAIKLDCTTAMGTPTGNNWMGFCQFVESQDIRFLGHGTSVAKPITLQFWIKSTKVGIATVQLLRHDASREYLAEYTINQSDTWEKKTITIPGDTSGTEAAFDNGRGFKLCFVLFAGSSRHGSVNTWRAQNGGYFGASANQVNLLDNASNNILFTGVQLEVGSVATDFEHRGYGQELDLCKRYYQQYGIDSFGNNTKRLSLPFINEAASNTGGYINFRFEREMRGTPTATIGSSLELGEPQVDRSSYVVSSFNNLHAQGSDYFQFSGGQLGSEGNTNRYIRFGHDANAFAKFSAEL